MIDGEQNELMMLSMAIQAGSAGPDVIEPFVSLPNDVFGLQVGRDVHAAIVRLHAAGKDIDELSVHSEAKSEAVKVEWLLDLTSNWVLMPYFEKLCDNALEAYAQRRVVSDVRDALKLAEEAETAEEARTSALGKLLAMEDVKPSNHVFSAVEALDAAITHTREMFHLTPEEKQKRQGVTTGFRSLDRILGGFQREGLYILGAGTGRGKSVLGLNFTRHAALAGHHVLYVSLEMAHTDLMFRLMSAEASISGQILRTGDLSEHQIESMVSATKRVRDYAQNITFFDQPGISLLRLGAVVRQVSARRKIDLVVIDYLQLLQAEKTYSREREVSAISSSLVALARGNGVPVVALSQLNQVGDIRESQAVKHDAYGVILIKYDQDEFPEDTSDVPADICVVKHRNGMLGRVPVTFERSFGRFVERRGW